MSQLKTSTVRRILALIFAGVLLVSMFSGCKKDDGTGESTAASTAATDTATPSPTVIPTEPPVGIKGTVTADELNVREGVGISYDVVAELKKGDTVEVFEQQDLNGIMWGRIDKGWICLTYVHLEGQPMEDPTEETIYEITDPIVGTVIATELNIRKGPSANYDVVDGLLKGEEVTITELRGTWGKCDKGWVNTIFVYFKDTIDAKTVKGVITADSLNLRIGPSTGYNSITELPNGTELTIYKQVTIRGNLWGYTGEGWVSMAYVEIQ